MAQFPLISPDLEYETHPGRRIRVHRLTLRATVAGMPAEAEPTVFVDTGAPVSIISHSVARYLAPYFRRVPVTLDPLPVYKAGGRAGGASAKSLLTWNGVRCDLRTVDVRLRDTATGVVSGPLVLLAKVMSAPLPHMLDDRFVIVGMDFLAANRGALTVQAAGYGLGGHLAFP